ncbi:MAG: peptidoglycan-binding protein [Pseudomonadota bacterium]
MADDTTESGDSGEGSGTVSAADFLAALQRIQNRLDRIESHLDTQQDQLRQVLDRPTPSLVYDENVETREPDLLADTGERTPTEPPENQTVSPPQEPPQAAQQDPSQEEDPALDLLLADGSDDVDETVAPSHSRPRRRFSTAAIAWIIIGLLVVVGGIYIATDDDRNQRLFGWLRGEPDTLSMSEADEGASTVAPGSSQPQAGTDAVGGQTDQGADTESPGSPAPSPTEQEMPGETGTERPDASAAVQGERQEPDQSQQDRPVASADEQPRTPDQPQQDQPAEQPGEQAGEQTGEEEIVVEEVVVEETVVEEVADETVVVEEVVDEVAVVEEAPLVDEDLAPLPPGAASEVRLLADAALRGDAPAQQELGSRYAEGVGVEQSYELAYYWFAQAAEQGVVDAIYNLGVMNDRGLGTERNQEQAFSLFLRAAEAGHPRAQLATGLSYAQGSGVEPDLTLATQWLQAASASGNPRGAFYMGRLFERGIDGAPDLAAAAGWYRIAADAGDNDAARALERLVGEDGEGPLAAVTSPGDRVPLPETLPTPVAAGAAEPVDREGIREIQTLLSELGFSPGPADGIMGNRTRSAIQAYQRLIGTPVTGEADTQLLARLREAASEE